MAEYIDVPNLILFLKCGEYESSEDIIKFIENNVTTDVIERSKIDDTIFEIKRGYYGDEEMSETDPERADAFNNGLSYALEILKRNIGE